jgi:DHA2 family multidrug resistance protein
MSYLGGNIPGDLEGWEQEYLERVSKSVADLSQRRRLIILLSIGLVTAIEISNRLSINVLLPDMQGNVAASSDEISWVVILYNLGFLCSLALSFWMTRLFGSRHHLLSSIGLYSIGAIGCACSSHSLRLLLLSRVIMGFGGGAFLVRTVIVAGLLFPGKARAFAVTCLYALLFVFQFFYPVSMGWINDTFHWNYAFLLDFPFLALGTYLIWKFVPWGRLTLRSDKRYVDTWGAGLLIASLASLQVATSRGERDEWLESPLIAGTLFVAVICFLVFIWWDSRPQNSSPVLHLRTIWRHLPLRAAFFITMIVGAILGAALFVIPQYLRHVQDYSATQTGGFISMYTAGMGIGLVFSLRVLLPRLGGPLTIAVGMFLLIATCINFIYIWTPTTPTTILLPSTVLQGFSMGPILLGASNISTGHAAMQDLNDVSTSYFFVRQLGNTFGVTAVTIMFDHRMTLHSSRLLDIANRLDPTVQRTLSQYAGVIERNGPTDPAQGALQLFQRDVIVQSQLLSYIDIYFGLAVLACSALLLLLISRIRRTSAKDLHFHLW